jgi:hypothetical protein
LFKNSVPQSLNRTFGGPKYEMNSKNLVAISIACLDLMQRAKGYLDK